MDQRARAVVGEQLEQHRVRHLAVEDDDALDALFERVLTLSNHGRARGQTRQFWPDAVGFKYKMSNIQAAIGCAQLERIEQLIARKRAILAGYRARLAGLAAERGVPIALMHNLPGGATGRHADLYPEGLLPGIVTRLRAGCRVALDAGVPWGQIIVDPGIGFAKGPEQNLETLRHLDALKVLGRPILLGTSRKGFIGQVLGGLPAAERVEGTGATVALGIAKGADMARVHDVRAMARVARMADTIGAIGKIT